MKTNIFEKEYAKLNEKQKKAVDTIYWPVMVIAWPWTGKTQIIWLRTANIILKSQVNPENILITTFTDSWVVAIRKRLEYFLWSDGYKVNVSTIHSFCSEVISTHVEKFLEFKANILVDDIDILEILTYILDEEIKNKNITNLTTDNDRYFYLRDIKARISNLKQEAISPDIFDINILNLEAKYLEELNEIKPTLKKYEKTKQEQEKHILKLKELNHIYRLYKSYLYQKWLYDFNDMINFVLQKFKTDEDLAYYYAEKYQFIMLDEFQDTNNSQNEIINSILKISKENNENANIMIVWDDDQSIYRFQWANIENMLDFATIYKDTEIIVLENNYRSTQKILDICSESISHNNQRITNKIPWLQKKLISSNYDNNTVSTFTNLYSFASLEEEYIYLLQDIIQKLITTKPEEIAIIVRNNKEVEKLSNFFVSSWLQVVSKLNTNILNNDYIIFIINYLKLLTNDFLEEEKVIDIFRNDILWINQVDIFKINKYLYNLNYTLKYKKTFLETIFDIDKLEIEFLDIESIKRNIEILNELKSKLFTHNFSEFFDEFLQKLHILDFIEKNWNFDDLQDIFTLCNKIKSFLELDNTFNLRKFLNKIDLYIKYWNHISRQNIKLNSTWINILTAHSSKWLEYEIVYVSWLYNWNWNNKKVIDKLKLPNIVWFWFQETVDPIEEERRLFFVAISRAKKELYLSFPKGIDGKVKLISSFVSEVQDLLYVEDINVEDKKYSDFIKNNLTKKTISYSNLELDYIKEFLSNYKLSPTDLNIFLEDPKKFLRQVIFKYPFIDNDATIFWKVYHRVLELFYIDYKKTWVLKDVWYLEFTFEVLLKKEVLIIESYEKLLEKWLKWLRWFYDNYKNIKKDIIFLEYNFRPKNILFQNIPLTWKIDKVEKIWDFSVSNNSLSWQLAFFKEEVILIDYKTWKPKSLNEIKWLDKNWDKKQWEWKYFRQLMFYKLLTELDNEFNSLFEVSWLALDFVEGRDWDYRFVNVWYTSEEFNEFKNELIDAWSKINDLEFWRGLL